MKESALAEITLRRYEEPHESGRELVKKICLSLGLLQEGDSRDVIVDILLVLLEAAKKKCWLNESEIKKKVATMRTTGIADSNIRRQLKRLRDLLLVEKNANSYRISEFSSLSKLFKEKIQDFLLPQIVKRVEEYLKKLEEEHR